MSDSPNPLESAENSDPEKRSGNNRRQLSDRRSQQQDRRAEERRVGPRRENDQSSESETEETFTGPDWMKEALQEAEKRQAEMPAMAPPPVEIPKEGESRKDIMTVEDDETFRRRNLILIAIILVLIVALLSVIFY
ncbi:MAG: hypothetical protein ACO24D_10250 [bacterium]|jgi:hypothetical protein|nr:hypothetical protein [Bacillota bacterium]